MRIVRFAPGDGESGDPKMFMGDARVRRLVGERDVASFWVSAVTFKDGARNRWHRHTTDQVLIVTAGKGLIASEREERQIESGDVVEIPAGERHWHGALPGHDMTHLSVLLPGEVTIEE